MLSEIELHPLDSRQKSVHGKRLSVELNGKLVNVSALARTLGENQSNLSKFLSGQRECTPSFARRVALSLGISTDELLDAIADRRLEKYL